MGSHGSDHQPVRASATPRATVALGAMSATVIGPRQPFVVMAKPVGPACNLKCDYCYYLDKAQLFPPRESLKMRHDVLETYIASFIAASPGPLVHFVWHGGEPTLAGIDFYRRVVELQDRHLPDGWSCLNNLQTNGTLLDEAWCAFLAEQHFTVGLSIDGPSYLHDAFRTDRRGRPTHARAMAGLRLLRAHGIEPDVLCTLNSANVEHPAQVYRFFVDEGVQWLQFLPVVKRTADGAVSCSSVTPEAMGSFLCAVFDEWIRYDVGSIGVQNFLECLLVVSGRPANLCVMAETCGQVPVVEHDGGLYSCDHFVEPHHYLGDIVRDGLGALIETTRQVSFGQAKRDLLPQECRVCPVGFLCHGGCPKDRFSTASDGEGALNYLCAGYRGFYGHVLPYLERMVGIARSGRPATVIMAELEQNERGERRRWQMTGRNDPCPCGSGAKYKHCCLPYRRR